MMTYVNFERQGLPIIEPPTVVEEKRKVVNRNLAGLKIPEGIFGFYFYEENTHGEVTNVSPWHFVGGQTTDENGKKTIKFCDGDLTSTFNVPEGSVLLPAQ